MTTKELKQLANRVVLVARSTRELLMTSYGNVEEYSDKANFSANVVTELDTKVEKYLKSELNTLLPDIGFVGEEEGLLTEENIYWLVDPIDGTSHYIRGMPFCTTIIALIENSKPILSVIYNFVSDEMYVAVKEGGAYMNDQPITTSKRPLHKALISYDINLENASNVKHFTRLSSKTGGLFNSINCGYELSMIAAGKMDGKVFISPYAKVWDYAAGVLLIEEAGGIVRNLGKDSFMLHNVNFYVGNAAIKDEIDVLFSTF